MNANYTECPPATNKCLCSTQTALSVRRAYPLAGCGYPHIRPLGVIYDKSKLAPTNHRKATRAIPENRIASLARPRSAAGESGAAGRGAHAVLPLPGHGLWFMLTADNDFGELEDYFVLCRNCKEA